jgi:hypothetical protein
MLHRNVRLLATLIGGGFVAIVLVTAGLRVA